MIRKYICWKYLSLELSGQLAVNTDFTINVGAKNIGNAEFYGSVDMAVIGADGKIKKRISTPSPEVSIWMQSLHIGISNAS